MSECLNYCEFALKENPKIKQSYLHVQEDIRISAYSRRMVEFHREQGQVILEVHQTIVLVQILWNPRNIFKRTIKRNQKIILNKT